MSRNGIIKRLGKRQPLGTAPQPNGLFLSVKKGNMSDRLRMKIVRSLQTFQILRP